MLPKSMLSAADCYTQRVVGSTIDEVKALLGVPFASHPISGMVVYIYHVGDDFLSLACQDNRVVRLDYQGERRAVPRVRPISKRPAFIRFADKRIQTATISLSVKSAVFEVAVTEQKDELSINSFVTVCMSFRTRVNTCSFITLAGHVINVKNNRVTILWDSPFETHSTRVLSEYISSHLALESLGKTVDSTGQHLLDEPGPVAHLIKSDLCVYCTEGVCGLGFNAHADKTFPNHGGIR